MKALYAKPVRRIPRAEEFAPSPRVVGENGATSDPSHASSDEQNLVSLILPLLRDHGTRMPEYEIRVRGRQCVKAFDRHATLSGETPHHSHLSVLLYL